MKRMMIRISGIRREATVVIWLMAALCMTSSCDDGRIYDEAPEQSASGGTTVRFSGELDGASGYPQGYTVALAGFTDGSDYAEISKNLSDGQIDMTLSGVGADVTRVEVCLLNSIRKRIVTFASTEVAPDAGIIDFDAGRLAVDHHAAIEQGVFAQSCERCHGAGGHAAAGLSLLRGESYASLVGVDSEVMPGMKRVAPGDADRSTLWLAVGTEESDSWAFSHRGILDADRRELILSWINNLSVNTDNND